MNPPPSPKSTPGPASKKHWSESRTFGTAVVLMLVLVSAALWGLHAQSTERLRAETTAQARLRVAQVTSAVSSAVSILFRTVDMAARELASAYAQSNGKGFDERARQAIERLPPGVVLQVAVIGADGYLAYSNLGVSERVFLGDREHFKVHLEGGRDQVYISRPVMGRVSKQWSIQFSRPIFRDGALAGVLVLSVSPAYLQEALADVALDSEDSVTVLRQSGEYLARNRDMDAILGKTADASRAYMAPGAPPTGSQLARSLIDQVERLIHWQRLEQYPVLVTIGLGTRAAFRPVERAIADDQLKTGVGLGVLWACGIGLAWLVRRVNAQGRSRRELEYVAMNDSLTGLRSRHALLRHLSQAITRASASGQRVGVLYMDLNGFKPVNDLHGHAAGDEVLKVVGARIRSCVRNDDVVARIGGDEFVVVLEPLLGDEALANLRSRIAWTLSTPINVADVEVRVGASIGLAVFPDHGGTADALLVHADREMYQRKGQAAAAAAAKD